MEPISTNPPIIDQIKQYLEIKIRLLKLEGIDKASGIIAEVIIDLIMIVFLLLTFIFFTVTLGLFAGDLLNSNWQGFGCVTLLYVVIIVAVKTFKTKLQNAFIRMFISKVFKEA